MKVVIPGGSGQVGTVLARAFVRDGHNVVVLSRRPQDEPRTTAPWLIVAWDGETLGPWTTELEAADCVINLAGTSVNCRYHAANRRRIIESRVRSTRAVGQAIARAASPPRVWLQASTATIYSHRYDAANDEARGILGGLEFGAPDSWRFSIDVAKAWEQAAGELVVPRTRKVLLRSAMMMSPDRGGIFDTLLGLVQRGLGGTCGDGRRFVSWIHEHDFVRAVNRLIDDETFAGPVNLAAPVPLPNVEFMRELRDAWGRSFGLPASRWMLELGAVFFRTETELILKSRRVVPRRLLDAGFSFEFPTWAEAARELCHRSRGGQ